MNKFFLINLALLLMLCSCKKGAESKTVIIDNKFSDFPYSHHFSVVMFNSDTVSFKVGEDKRYPLIDSLNPLTTYEVKMYYPIKEYFVNGKNVFQGERKMYLKFGLDTVNQEPYNNQMDQVLFGEHLEVKSDTGYLKFNLADKMDLSQLDSINWEASIYISDTGFVEYGKFYFKSSGMQHDKSFS